jgi:hypothetical protein
MSLEYDKNMMLEQVQSIGRLREGRPFRQAILIMSKAEARGMWKHTVLILFRPYVDTPGSADSLVRQGITPAQSFK